MAFHNVKLGDGKLKSVDDFANVVTGALCDLVERNRNNVFEQYKIKQKTKCFINCETCSMKLNKGPHVCRICKAENMHTTSECPQKIICFINCETCKMKPNKGPHICRTCKAENIHRTSDCPQNIKKPIHEIIKNMCWCKQHSHKTKCPFGAVMKDNFNKCFMNCETCTTKPNNGPHVCRKCKAENMHAICDCPRIITINKCFINCDTCKLKPNKGPHICRSCKGENIHLTMDCPK
jgi:hypothetical protein